MKSRVLGRLLVAIWVIGLIFIMSGCIERTETIRVEPDGTVYLQVVFRGDPDDIQTGDALLSEPGPWSIVDTVQLQDDGSEKLVRTATLTVKPGERLPDQYCPENSDLSGVALSMPTFLRIEEKSDGTYYHFRRDYERRDWACIDYFRRKLVEHELEAIQGKKLADVPAEQRESLTRGLIEYEKAKVIELAWAANETLYPQLEQDQWLVLRQGIDDVYNRIDIKRIVEILQMKDQQAGEEIRHLTDEISLQIHRVISQTLSEVDATGLLGQQFVEQFEIERRRRMISEDLQDESWQVSVQLPGRLVGHNGDYVEGNVVIWKFAGDAINDRDQTLMATSVVAKK